MTKPHGKQRGPGRPPVHDPAVIQRLLSEREHTGETYVQLEARSGIPAGTLSSHARSAAQTAAKRSAFVEVIVADDGHRQGADSDAFEVIIASVGESRRVLVPTGFDASELRRLVDALEDRC